MEKWKKIKGYEDYYEISNYGNVKSVERIVEYKNGRKAKYKSKLRKPSKSDYRLIALSKNGNIKVCKISRLVAIHFIPNNNNKKVVNHIDGNKHNDNVENLEWCSYSENNIHAFETGLRSGVNKVSGVFYDKTRGKWASYLYRDNKNIFIGRFETEDEAIESKLKALKRYESKH